MLAGGRMGRMQLLRQRCLASSAAPFMNGLKAVRKGKVGSMPRAFSSANDEGDSKKALRQQRLDKYGPQSVVYSHDVDDLSTSESTGRFYPLGEELLAKLPEGLAGDSKEDEAWTSGQGLKSVMVRDDFVTVAKRMDQLENMEQVPDDWKAMALVGDRGSGKSMTLNLAVLRARQKGWLTMFVHDCREWVTPKGAHLRGTGTGTPIVDSKVRPKMFNQPLGAQETLKKLVAAHKDKLIELPKRRKYRHKAYDYEGDKSLMTIATRGLKSKAFASDAVYDLRMEFGLVTEYPVLIAVDQMNALYWPTCMYTMGQCVAPSSLIWAEAFRAFDLNGCIRPEHKLKRGLILAGTTAKYGWPVSPEKIVENHRDTGMHYFRPFDVRHGGIEQRPDWMPEHKWQPRNTEIEEVESKPLSQKEARFYIIGLKQNDIIYETGKLFQEEVFQTLLTTSGGNPRILRENILNPFF